MYFTTRTRNSMNKPFRRPPLISSVPFPLTMAGLPRGPTASEEELQGELDQPRVARLHDAAEVTAIGDVTVRGHELRVV